jgi:hypothetical protein
MDGANGTIQAATKWTPTSEIIGRRGPVRAVFPTITSIDWSRADASFWDQLRRGKKADYEIGGLFTRPITRILTSWMLGKGMTVKSDSEPTMEAGQEFVNNNLETIVATVDDSLALGDSYLIVNPDGTLARVGADQVEILAEPAGSQNVSGYRVTTKLESMTIVDTYKLDGRTLEINKGGQKTEQTFPNLIGMIPVVHFPSDRAANEIYGRPYYEQLLKLFQRYDRTINKSLDGVDIMGNPVPTIEGVEDPDETLQQIATSSETFTDSSGTERTRYQVDFNDLPIMVVGKGGAFKFAGPQAFTQDAGRMLEFLFLLMLQTTGIPEGVWGGAIASSKASLEAQMPAFERLIEALRLVYSKPLVQLVRVWLAWQSLVESGMQPDSVITLSFPSILQENREQKLAEIESAYDRRAIRKVTYLRLLNLVEDPEAEVKAAEAEAETADEAVDQALDKAIKTARGKTTPDEDTEDEEGKAA